MKFAIRNRSLNADWWEGMRIVADLGFDGVELVVQEEQEISRLMEPGGASEVLSWCKEQGCEVSSLSVGPYRRHSFAVPTGDLGDGVQFVSRCVRAGAKVRGLGPAASPLRKGKD